jgi:hypothetical protein
MELCKNGHEQTPENIRWHLINTGKPRKITCRLCNNARAKKNRENNPNIRRYWLDRKLMDKYGITRAQWRAKFDEQGGCCAGCFIAFGTEQYNKPCVDHCHRTGEFRGLLCHACNRGIGLLQESISTLQGLISYLQKFR